MENAENKTDYLKSPLAIAFAIASVKIILFLIAGTAYGYFRDELYWSQPLVQNYALSVQDFSCYTLL
jgi:p-aminobenzoyl-glutamate transporter AbgT